MEIQNVTKLAIALGLGLLVGFQRQWTAPHVAGIRTFGLLTVFGALLAILDGPGSALVVAGLIGVAAILLLGYVSKLGIAKDDPGLTTQVAGLLMYAVGVAIGWDQLELAVIVGGATAVLLQWKRPLHGFVQRLGQDDVRAITQLVLIALVILPVLPNRSFDRYGVLNPFEIWLMVVLIVGVSLGGYIGAKFLGAGKGTLLAGFFGGLVSSTATTFSSAHGSRLSPSASAQSLLIIAVSSTVVFVRVLLEVAIVAPEFLPAVAPPMLIMLLVLAAISGCVALPARRDPNPNAAGKAPSELKAAIAFGLLYAVILFAVAAAKDHFGTGAAYGVAALSGLTDMDAITLSTAQLVKKSQLDPDVGWRMILVAAVSNLVFKLGIVLIWGSRKLGAGAAMALGLAIVAGLLLLGLWPGILHGAALSTGP